MCEARRALGRGVLLAAPAGRPRRASPTGCEGGRVPDGFADVRWDSAYQDELLPQPKSMHLHTARMICILYIASRTSGVSVVEAHAGGPRRSAPGSTRRL